MKKYLWSLMVLLLFLFGYGGCGGGGGGTGVADPTPQPTPLPTLQPTVQPTPEPSAIDGEIEKLMDEGDLPGVSAAIVKAGRIVWMKSFGYGNYESKEPFTNSTPLMLASVSKVFTGMALMRLYQEGRFELDDDVNGYLPVAIHVPGYESSPITFRMLLTHTASVADNDDIMDSFYNWNGDPTISLKDSVTGYLTTSGPYYDPENFYDDRPGTFYEYSNMGAALEGYLVECISGRPFNEYCNAHIFDPLGMHATRWFLSEYEDAGVLANPHERYRPINNYGFADYPDGMLHSSVADLARFMLAVLAGGILEGANILSSTNLNAMFTVQNSALAPTQGLQFYQEEFRVQKGRKLLWGHSGGERGIATEMYFDLDKNLGIVVLANGEDDQITMNILEKLYDYALGL